MTKQQLEAENERLGKENAGLRDLLAAVSAYADVPHPASYDNNRTYEYELERRVDGIAIWANGDQDDMAPDVYVLVIQDRAKHLREEAARPVRYEVRAEPAPVEPVSPEVAEQLYDAIVAGTPVLVTDDKPERLAAASNSACCSRPGCAHVMADHSDYRVADEAGCSECACQQWTDTFASVTE